MEQQTIKTETLKLIRKLNKEVICKKCGLINDYGIEISGNQFQAICNGCLSYIKFLRVDPSTTFHFGKYAGKCLNEVKSDLQYLQWLIREKIVRGYLKDEIIKVLNNC